MVFRHLAFLILSFTLLACMRTALAGIKVGAQQFAKPAAVNVFEDSTQDFPEEATNEAGDSYTPDVSDPEEESDVSDADVEDWAPLDSEFQFEHLPKPKYSSKNEDATSFANDPLTYPP